MPTDKKILLLGYGNVDRQDDGVAWHILAHVSKQIDRPANTAETGSVDSHEPFQLTGENPDFLFVLQLTPELAETVAQFDRVCFVDAHTGNIEEDIRFQKIEGQFQSSPFTHHLTAQTLLVLAETLYGKKPEAFLLSVRGFEFGFSQDLSLATGQLSLQAAQTLVSWIRKSILIDGQASMDCA